MRNSRTTSEHFETATNALSLAAAAGLCCAVCLATTGCATIPARSAPPAVPGEEVLLHRGDPAPFEGVLLPPGIYESVIDEIDARYDAIYGQHPTRYRRSN